ncbi:MAG: MnhB domain-containing protein [Candidatus Nitrotoga sp.]|nr:MnhB domain-containing protein [Candidatus Nitrotoga sp.]MDO9447784.1 MnhB domain-containing protein [Candidatus Nitrotoga sp.]MDP3497904.1 MnhB domain-containing protein [Candidatus Nitrotoga sp.]
MKILIRMLVLVSIVMLGLAIAWTMLQLPPPAVRLAEHVGTRLDASGVKHAVTAVLLNFRGYDTLLEIAVLLLALLGVLVAAGEPSSGQRMNGSPQPILQSMARILVPLMVLIAGYLLWAGSHRPGGAFQAGAVLAAAGVLLHLAGLMPAWGDPGRLLRAGLTEGFLLFLSVATLPLLQGAMLQYPPRWAGALILAIEAGLTLSLALMLVGLFLWLPNENEEAKE